MPSCFNKGGISVLRCSHSIQGRMTKSCFLDDMKGLHLRTGLVCIEIEVSQEIKEVTPSKRVMLLWLVPAAFAQQGTDLIQHAHILLWAGKSSCVASRACLVVAESTLNSLIIPS